jgi:hypothetical protein
MGEEKRAFKGVWICAAIFLDERLTPSEKMLLAEIDSLTTEDHGCYASNAHFAKRLGVTESRANHVLSRLTREGYIVRVCYDGRISHRVVAPEYSSNPVSPNHPLLRVVAECPFLPCSGILLAGRVAVNPACVQNSALFNLKNHRINTAPVCTC